MNGDGSGKKQLTDARASARTRTGRRTDAGSSSTPTARRRAPRVYSMRADGTDVRRLTESPALDALPAYSPDGRQIVFVSDRARKDSRKLYVMSAGGGDRAG